MKKLTKKTVKRTVSLLLAVSLAAAIFFMPSAVKPAYASNASVKMYEEKIAQLEAEQAELKKKISGIENEQSAVSEKKQYLDSLVTTVSQKIQASQQLIEELNTQIAEAQTAIAQFETTISETTERIRERMRLNQETGTESYLSVLIGAEDIGDFLSRFERLSNMLEYDKENLESYKKQKEELNAQVADLKASQELQKQTLEKLEADKAESESLVRENEAYWNNLQADKKAYQAQYEKKKAAEQALDNELAAMLRSIANQNSSQVTADGAFMWPLPVGQGYISCRFGGADPNGAPHYAVDCAISGGTPIYASNDGTVVRAEGHWSYGNYVLLDHGNGLATLYAHCSSLAVSAGQTVTKGQVIGYVGSTGFSTGCHLHFEFRVNGNRVNPLNYMSAGC